MDFDVTQRTKRAGGDPTCAAVVGDSGGFGPASRDVQPPTRLRNGSPAMRRSLAQHRSDTVVLCSADDKSTVTVSRATCPFCGSDCLAHATEGQEQCRHCGRTMLLLHSEAAVPALYGQHRAIRFAGRGGMGLVMRGINENTGQPVAIKLLIEREQPRQAAIARYHREVAALRNLGHPNIVRLLSHGTIGKHRFLVMDWVEGPTVRDVIAAFRRRMELPSFEVTRRWMLQLCAGLSAIHAAGVIHRDIKPSNLIVENGVTLRIADFGIARRPAEDASFSYLRDHAHRDGPRPGAIGSPFGEPLTSHGEVPGTADYMAPECIRSLLTGDVRSDFYSLGVTFYEFVTGQRPQFHFTPPSMLNLSLPAGFDAMMLKLLAENPGARFSSAGQVVSALDNLTPRYDARLCSNAPVCRGRNRLDR